MVTNFVIDTRGTLGKYEAYSQNRIIWIDVVNPTPEERKLIDSENGISLPQHHETVQIEYSNRFYEEENAYYLTISVLVKAAPYPESQTVTFILTQERVITLRYANPNPINSFVDKLQQRPYIIFDAFDMLVLLLQQVVGATANIFEMLATSSEMLALSLMQTIDGTTRRDHSRLLNKTLREINRLENVLSKGFQSLSSLTLLINYFERSHSLQIKNQIVRLDSLVHDISGLVKHADYLTQKLEFQLESTLGLLNIEQTYIIKMFTVLAMVFMPPTLLASIYGMNFHFMPELKTIWGYPIAILLMIFSSFMPYRFFKKRGWI